ncbi:MAG: septation protein SepH [Rothia sp. (in: high G+C Gram-positive bacteria)]|nr:septation protein SepH [Rothia sp. (in: high G+C Gram-positive bacteria)]
MLELHLAGIHDDGEHLVLESAEGSQFSLQIDQELRASISRARKIQPARERLKMSDFGPRDIQSRFRQGATVEEIVAESGWDADRVRRYEWPIVAERANIINVARSLLISQSHTGRSSDASALPLEEHIIRVAKKYKFSQAQPDWNTFQQESGQWTISLDFDLTEQMKAAIPRGIVFPARWSYNPANQSIYASNEAAYFLMGRDHSTDAPLPGIGANEPTPTERLPLVSEAAEKTHTPTIKAVQPNKTTAQDRLLEELASRRGDQKISSARERKLADLLERARRGPEQAGLGFTPESLETGPIPAPSAARSQQQEQGQDSLPSQQSQQEAGQSQKPQRSTQKAKRASVPSWDDIIFGNQRQ